MKKLLIGCITFMWLSACATKDGYVHPHGAPKISYSQSTVFVSLPYNDVNNRPENKVLYLNSNVHGKRLSSMRVVPATELKNQSTNNDNKFKYSIFSQPANNSSNVFKPAWYNPPNVARFNLPKSMPATDKQACFYVTNQSDQIIPVRAIPSYQTNIYADNRSNQSGFNNPVWQQTYGLEPMKIGVENAIKQVDRELTALNQKIVEATDYVTRADIIENNQCFVPPHSGPPPTPPFSSDYLSQREFMPNVLCLQGNQVTPSVTAKLLTLKKETQSFVLDNIEQIRKTTAIISTQLKGGLSPQAFPEFIERIFANKTYSKSCSGSACKYERKLYEDSIYRIYADNYYRCVSEVGREIDNFQSSYVMRQKAWQNEPQQRYQLCQTQLRLFNTRDIQLSQLEKRKTVLQTKLLKLQSLKSKSVEQRQRFLDAYHTPCNVEGA